MCSKLEWVRLCSDIVEVLTFIYLWKLCTGKFRGIIIRSREVLIEGRKLGSAKTTYNYSLFIHRVLFNELGSLFYYGIELTKLFEHPWPPHKLSLNLLSFNFYSKM